MKIKFTSDPKRRHVGTGEGEREGTGGKKESWHVVERART